MLAVDFDWNFSATPSGLLGLGFGIGEDSDGANSVGVIMTTLNGSPFRDFGGAARVNDNLDSALELPTSASDSGTLFLEYQASSGNVIVGASQSTGASLPDSTDLFPGIQRKWNDENLLVSLFIRSDAIPPLLPHWQSGQADAVFSNLRVLTGSPTAIPEPGRSIALLADCDGHHIASSTLAYRLKQLFSLCLALSIIVWIPNKVNAQPVGDGVADDTAALQQAADSGGSIQLPKGIYRLTKTVTINLDQVGWTSLSGNGVAQIRMEGPGPALRFIGTHDGTASPATVKENVWRNQRTPMVDGIEILGAHDDACGIEATGTMQLTLTRVVVRRAKHAIHLTKRNRNVTLSECHLYENRGIGVFLDHLNLHQINIANCHISTTRAVEWFQRIAKFETCRSVAVISKETWVMKTPIRPQISCWTPQARPSEKSPSSAVRFSTRTMRRTRPISASTAGQTYVPSPKNDERETSPSLTM